MFGPSWYITWAELVGQLGRVSFGPSLVLGRVGFGPSWPDTIGTRPVSAWSVRLLVFTSRVSSIMLPSERNSHRRSPFTLGHHLPTVGAGFSNVIVSHPSIQIPHVKKMLRYSGPTAKAQAPKTPRTDTILPEHLLAHTLITYVYSHYCIWSFCHHFPCKKWCFNHQCADRIFR